MCFSSPKTPETPDPAPAPPPPSDPAETQQIGQTRKRENVAYYGNSDGPDTRVERPTQNDAGANTNYRM